MTSEKIMLYVIGFAWIAVMIYVVVAYNRKQRERGAARAQQMAALLADVKPIPTGSVIAAGATTTAAPAFIKRQRLLSPAMTLHYYVFRAGLPDHEIFTGLALNDIVDVAAPAGSAQRETMQRRLAQQRLDLVVCNKQLEVVAAVVVANSAPAARAGDFQFTRQCLTAAGVRVVNLDPAMPPQHTEIRAMIYG
jgi:hypothetical protein